MDLFEAEEIRRLCENFEKLTYVDQIRIAGIVDGMVIARELVDASHSDGLEPLGKNSERGNDEMQFEKQTARCGA